MLPGLLMTLIFALFCVMSATIRPVHKPASWVGWSQLRSAVRQAFWALMMPPIVLGGIYFGVFTVTEAAVVGCLYALLVGAGIYRNFGFRDLWQTAYETVRSSAMQISPDMDILEIGCGIGDTACYFAKQVVPKGHGRRHAL